MTAPTTSLVARLALKTALDYLARGRIDKARKNIMQVHDMLGRDDSPPTQPEAPAIAEPPR